MNAPVVVTEEQIRARAEASGLNADILREVFETAGVIRVREEVA
jgi:hypothetical protein